MKQKEVSCFLYGKQEEAERNTQRCCFAFRAYPRAGDNTATNWLRGQGSGVQTQHLLYIKNTKSMKWVAQQWKQCKDVCCDGVEDAKECCEPGVGRKPERVHGPTVVPWKAQVEPADYPLPPQKTYRGASVFSQPVSPFTGDIIRKSETYLRMLATEVAHHPGCQTRYQAFKHSIQTVFLQHFSGCFTFGCQILNSKRSLQNPDEVSTAPG